MPDKTAFPLPARRGGLGWGGPLAEDAQRQVERDSPVGLVDDLADPQVPGQAAQDVRVLAAQSVVGLQPIDGVTHRIARVLHQVGAKGANRVVSGGVAPRLERRGGSNEVVAPGAWRAALDHSKPE